MYSRGCRVSYRLQKTFGNVKHGPGKDLKHSFVLVSEGGNDRKQLWVARVLLPSKSYAEKDNVKGEFAAIQYMECSCPTNGTDETLECFCLQCSTHE